MRTNDVTHDVSYLDRVQGAYWFFTDNNEGQWSDEYRILSLLSETYTPGPMESSDTIEDDALAHYEMLEARA